MVHDTKARVVITRVREQIKIAPGRVELNVCPVLFMLNASQAGQSA